MFSLSLAQMGGFGDDSITEQSAIQAYLGTGDVSLPHSQPQSRGLPLGVNQHCIIIVLSLSLPLSSQSH